MACAERFLRVFVFEILLFDQTNAMLALVWCVRLRWFLFYTVSSLSWGRQSQPTRASFRLGVGRCIHIRCAQAGANMEELMKDPELMAEAQRQIQAMMGGAAAA